ncbi:MAG: M56 family metallopeptidase [Solirubrobacterales bacterium]|nr:M56 family metallopeptidase [Solirubrobacterales bacterium]
MSVVLTVLVAGGILAPHGLGLRRAAPAIAATIWLAALALRALTVVYLAMYLLMFLPATEAFVAVTHWCWHTVIPLLTTHLGLDGHRIGDTAVILPAVVVAASLVSVTFGVVRAARAVRRLLTSTSLGPGPSDSLIVGGAEVVVAAAGISRPRIVVSAGALTALDDEELAAGLDHERGHIERHHRFVFVFAELCRGLARFLPGTRQVMSELTFHLERDADRWALARRHDPFALASAICKAATARATNGLALTSLSGSSSVTDRLDELVDGPARDPARLERALLRGTAWALVSLALALAAVLPATAVAAGGQAGDGPSASAQAACEH